jgi:hypothetical protein
MSGKCRFLSAGIRKIGHLKESTFIHTKKKAEENVGDVLIR